MVHYQCNKNSQTDLLFKNSKFRTIHLQITALFYFIQVMRGENTQVMRGENTSSSSSVVQLPIQEII
jgi:hypothetical protein